jgi:hypothetical protein
VVWGLGPTSFEVYFVVDDRERQPHAIPFISSEHRLNIRKIGDRRNQRRFAWGGNPKFRNAARHS